MDLGSVEGETETGDISFHKCLNIHGEPRLGLLASMILTSNQGMLETRSCGSLCTYDLEVSPLERQTCWWVLRVLL